MNLPPERRRFLQSALTAAATLSVPSAMRSALAAEPGRALIGFQLHPSAIRMISAVLAEVGTRYRPDLGSQPVVLPGASGALAVETVIRSPGDGATALIAPSSIASLLPVMRKLPADFIDGLVPVAGIGQLPLAFVVGPAVPVQVRTMAAYIEWVRSDPKMNNVAVPALGTAPHFVGNEIARLADLPLRAVAYKGTLALAQDIQSGNIPAGVTVVPADNDSPGVRLLALASERRLDRFPELPTLREAGFDVNIPMESLGFFLPAATPAAKVAELQIAVRAATRTAAVKAAMAVVGMTSMSHDEEGYGDTIANERATWLSLVRLRKFTG